MKIYQKTMNAGHIILREKEPQDVSLPPVFLDMDGVLAAFMPGADYEAPGYFRRLLPLQKGLALAADIRAAGLPLAVLSKVTGTRAADEKLVWLSEHFPDLPDLVIFAEPGEEKEDCAGKIGDIRGVRLIDDYTDNLLAWEKAGGCGVKFINGINGTRGRWTGARI